MPKVGIANVETALPQSRRGRPTADRAAALDETILEAALGLFVEFGYEAGTMDAIALRARVSKGTLYARFQNKEALFRAVLERQVKRWSALNARMDDSRPTAFAPRLRSHALTIQRMLDWPEFRHVSRLIRTATVSLPDVAPYWQEIGGRAYVRFLAESMRDSAGAAAVPGTDWIFLANMFLHAFGGWYEAELAHPPVDPADVDAFADKLVASIVRLAGIED